MKKNIFNESAFHLWTTISGLIWTAWLLGSGRFKAFYIAPDFHPGFGTISWLTPWIAYTLMGLVIAGLLTGIFKRTRVLGNSLAAVALLALLLADKIAYLHTPYLLVLMLIWSVALSLRPALSRHAKWMLPIILTLALLRFGIDSRFASNMGVTLIPTLPDIIGSLSVFGFGLFWLSPTQAQPGYKVAFGLLAIPVIVFLIGLTQGPTWTPSSHYFTWQYTEIPTTWQHQIRLQPKDATKQQIRLNSSSVFGPYTGHIASDKDLRQLYLGYIINNAQAWWGFELESASDEVFFKFGEGASQRYTGY